jgi:hypothetical protein
LKQSPLSQSLRCIQPQQLYGQAAHYGNGLDALSIQSEMIGPSIMSRMKKRDSLSGTRID